MKNKFNYGAVFKITREDDISSIEMNFKKMKESGFNTVVVWPAVFWWEEKGEDYPFATGKKVLDIAEKIGLKIVMELAGQLTAMEYSPDFLMKEDYDALDKVGHREFAQGSFGFINYYHPEVKNMVCEHYKKAAEAYKGHPALLAYDIFNETMFRSFDEYTFSRFREWLKNKYTTIDKLNSVWERSYTDFSQIRYEEWKWMSIMPAADYNAFRKESIAIILKDWYAAIRFVDKTTTIMADNVYAQASPLGLYFRPQDDFGLKTVVDEIGMSFYPKQKNGTFETALRWEMFDSYYAASGGVGFWVAEMQSHNQSLFTPQTSVDPKELKHWCLEGYAAGAKSLIYWMWRPFDKGIQTLGRGLVNYKGQATKRLEAAKELSEIFESIGVIKPLKSDIGIVYNPLCEDFARLLSTCSEFEENIYNLSIFGAYKAFLKNNVRCDIITLDNIMDYKVIVLTNHLVLSNRDAQLLREYVLKGGTIIADGHFGTVDETSMLNGVLPGGELNPLIGEEFFDFDNKEPTFTYEGVTLTGCCGREQMELTDGEMVTDFDDGMPAVVMKKSGEGSIITFNTTVWYGYGLKEQTVMNVDDLAKTLAKKFSLKTVETQLDVSVRVSENETEYFAFIFNYSDERQKGTVSLYIGDKRYDLTADTAANDTEIITIKK